MVDRRFKASISLLIALFDINFSNPIFPGTHRIYVITDKSTTKGTFEISSSKMDITSFTGGTGYHVNTTSGLHINNFFKR